MDWLALGNKALDIGKKYRYAILIVVLGLIFLLFPAKNTEKTEKQEETMLQQSEKTQDITKSLTNILKRIEGVGDVEVLLTFAAGEKVVYQTDHDITNGENGTSRVDTVIITDSNREETGLIQQIIPASYQGAIVVCKGADSPSVRLAIVQAVANVTGLGADRICVLKMQ